MLHVQAVSEYDYCASLPRQSLLWFVCTNLNEKLADSNWISSDDILKCLMGCLD